MDEKQRVALIRKGNELYNEGKLEDAIKIFSATGYKDGLTRVGDYYFFDKKMPIIAYKYYKLAGRKDRIDDIFTRMIFALQNWVKAGDGEAAAPVMKITLPEPKVSPKLKLAAEEILRRNEEEKKKA
ncbi:MAG: hypothetical protein ACRCUT_13690 [Spirochaetota bacterium]